jgi:hypothetical protein
MGRSLGSHSGLHCTKASAKRGDTVHAAPRLPADRKARLALRSPAPGSLEICNIDPTTTKASVKRYHTAAKIDIDPSFSLLIQADDVLYYKSTGKIETNVHMSVK